ncbi:MAG TPA: acetyl-CoA carboxylase biotin carboxylase subunit [Candidatus Xenobia bacterium]|jgi:acetyl-CoA carboxylase biotin carboxylase subunit
MFKKILIANRGEIAVRIVRACKEMGIRSVAVYSQADRESLHVQYADEAFCVGPAPVGQSYLNVPNIISAALVSGADAVHPGYGFLAENAGFAEICKSHRLAFIGPTADAIRLMGDKSQARETMQKAQVPTLPGTTTISDEDTALAFAREHGFPIVIKATAGGGGKGMRVVRNFDEMPRHVAMARAEAQAAFGDDRIYLEKFLAAARHIEIQVVADQHGNVIHLGERDCSLQRRHQKVVEEAPSTVVSAAVRQKMGEAAIAGARAAGYSSVGTVEFLFDPSTERFYFLEMNTRIQVEHPVTELVTGVDLVRLQIESAAGERLPLSQSDVRITGHAIECRITAEDWRNGFAPSTGRVGPLIFPGGPGVRVDSHIYEGYKIPPFYDSLLAKLIVHAKDRPAALVRMGRALDEMRLEGVHSTVTFLHDLLTHPDVVASRFHTTWLEQTLRAKENLAVGH